MKIQKRENTPLLFIMIFSVFAYGAYYDFIVFFIGIILSLLILYEIKTENSVKLPSKLINISFALMILGHIICMFFAINTGLTFVGLLRIICWYLFIVYSMTYTNIEKEDILKNIAYEGTILASYTIIDFLFNNFNGLINANGRIDGFFQYANVWALFLLICMLILLDDLNQLNICCITVLTLGIFLSGSRTIIVLFVIAIFFYTIKKYFNQHKKILACFFSIGILGLIANFFSNGLFIDRLITISLTSSTLNGRFLYMKDALSMLFENPLGIGKSGFYYLQTSMQTGIYTSYYVHNSFLQIALDGGILSCIGFSIFKVYSVFKQTKITHKLAMLVIILHMLIDFSLEYMVINWIFILLFEEEGILYEFEKIKFNIAIGTTFVIIFTYFTIVYHSYYAGNYGLCYVLFPQDLLICENKLQSNIGWEEKVELSEKILENNDLSILALDCLYKNYNYQKDNYNMVLTKYKYLCLNYYNESVYINFTELLENRYLDNFTNEELSLYKEVAINSINLLKEVEKNTSKLAYNTIECPKFDFSQEIIARLEKIN